MTGGQISLSLADEQEDGETGQARIQRLPTDRPKLKGIKGVRVIDSNSLPDISLPPSSGETRLPVYFSICCLNRSSPNTQVQLVEWRISSGVWSGIILSNRAAYRFVWFFLFLPAPDRAENEENEGSHSFFRSLIHLVMVTYINEDNIVITYDHFQHYAITHID